MSNFLVYPPTLSEPPIRPRNMKLSRHGPIITFSGSCRALPAPLFWTPLHTYRISLKSRRGEILFQGSVWCGDNSRAARFRGRRLQRSIRTHVHSFNSYMHVKCPCAYGNCCRPLTMRRDFEGGVYWDELADRCGDISRAAGFRGAARFRGNTVSMVGRSTISQFHLTNLPPHRRNWIHLFSSPLLHEGCNNRSTVYLAFNLVNPHTCNNWGTLQKRPLEFGYWDH